MGEGGSDGKADRGDPLRFEDGRRRRDLRQAGAAQPFGGEVPAGTGISRNPGEPPPDRGSRGEGVQVPFGDPRAGRPRRRVPQIGGGAGGRGGGRSDRGPLLLDAGRCRKRPGPRDPGRRRNPVRDGSLRDEGTETTGKITLDAGGTEWPGTSLN